MKMVNTGDQGKGSSVVPLHVQLPLIIYMLHGAMDATGHRAVGVIHIVKDQSCSGRIPLFDAVRFLT